MVESIITNTQQNNGRLHNAMQAALCALIGMAFSNLYLLWLFYDIDNVKGTDKVPLKEAEKVRVM